MAVDKGEDIALVQECTAGSEHAWARFHTRFSGLVLTIVKRKLGPYAKDPEDLAQNVFMSLIGSLKNYDPAYPLPRYVAMITERACIQEYRSVTAIKRDAPTESLDAQDADNRPHQPASPGLSPEDLLANSETSEFLKKAIRALDERCRELLRMRYFDEMPYKQIAQVFSSTENTVTVQASRCMAELRVKYQRIVKPPAGHRAKK